MSEELKRTLYVEIVGANDLMPKDGQGSASPYCVLEYDGQRQQTETKVKELNPVWNAVLSFIVFQPNAMDAQDLRVSVFSAKKGIQRDPKFLGRVRIRASAFAKKGEEALVYYKLKRRRNLFSQVKGEIGVKVWWADEPLVPPPPPPEAPPAEAPQPAEAPAPPPSADPSPEAPADPVPPVSEITPEQPPEPVAAPSPEPAPLAPAPPPAEPPAVDKKDEPAPTAEPPAEPAPAEEPGDKKDDPAATAPEAAAADVKKEEAAVMESLGEVIENEVLVQPVYWDHNLPYACEVPWNNFIPSSVLDNPYVNLPRVEWV